MQSVGANINDSLLSGGADASIKLWDLERAESTRKRCVHQPLGTVEK